MGQPLQAIPFGDKYLLVEHIATGGMAEIYRAQYTGIEGFAKDLVVKRLREEYAKRPEVVEMFLTEAKVAATLTHNNIIHTYDLGEIDREYFIAMELLRGEELVNVLRRGVALSRPLSVAHAVGVTQQVLEGLHYAHERARNGESLGIVHRDINPTNVYVGFDGVCKIVDFGIVLTRATERRKTDKFAGKMSYMAPEQMLGEAVDRRADIFPVGVMLYEMTVGQRLFRGNPQEVRRRVLAGDIPAPTLVHASYPPKLEAIVLKALERDPERRYQNCDHMYRDLDEYLQSAELSWTPRSISAYLSELFGEGAPANVEYGDEFQDVVEDPFAPQDLEDALHRFRAARSPWAKLDAPQETKPRRAMTLGSIAALVPDEPRQSTSPWAPVKGPYGGRPRSMTPLGAPVAQAPASASQASASASHASASGSHASASGSRASAPHASASASAPRPMTAGQKPIGTAPKPVPRAPASQHQSPPLIARNSPEAVEDWSSGKSFNPGIWVMGAVVIAALIVGIVAIS